MQRDLLQRHCSDIEGAKESYRMIYQTGSRSLFFAHCKDQNETWVPLLEKAFAKVHGDYASLDTGWMGEGVEDLSGGVTTQVLASDILDTQEYWDTRLSRVNRDFLFGVSAGVLEDGYGERNGITEGHSYVIMEVYTLISGQRLLKLRNPWGGREGIWKGAWSDGSREWTKEAQEELGHRFGHDSTFWISYEDLLDRITCFDQTRLFLDPKWRCCQRWMSIPVPWESRYQSAFLVHLTMDASPLVLVLSQLDKRYFNGLHGEYSFRLHFRLHDENGGRNDFALSHGSYLMSRSVSVELPDLPRGDYTISVKITAERDPDAKSVEKTVLMECEERTNNEKLIQVGFAYDEAHSKVRGPVGYHGSLDHSPVESECRASCSTSTAFDDSGSESEERDGAGDRHPRPWNAVCVVGIRIYSKDEHLQVQSFDVRQ